MLRKPRNIPANTLESLRLYVEKRILPGDFLTAVLENDLKMAFGTADEYNLDAMFEIVSYVYNKLPAVCWGSPKK